MCITTINPAAATLTTTQTTTTNMQAQTLQPAPCPSCGACPTCGRGSYRAYPWGVYPYPWYPYQYYPTYQPQPVFTYGTTCGGQGLGQSTGGATYTGPISNASL